MRTLGAWLITFERLKAIVSRLACNVGDLAAGHVFDLGYMGGALRLARGETGKGYLTMKVLARQHM